MLLILFGFVLGVVATLMFQLGRRHGSAGQSLGRE